MKLVQMSCMRRTVGVLVIYSQKVIESVMNKITGRSNVSILVVLNEKKSMSCELKVD